MTVESSGLASCLRFQSCLLSPLVLPSCTALLCGDNSHCEEEQLALNRAGAGDCAGRDLGRRGAGIPARMSLGLRREGVGIEWKVTEISGEKSILNQKHLVSGFS